MATIYDIRSSTFINVLTLMEKLTISGSLHMSNFEVKPFTIPAPSSLVIGSYVMRWITTVWLFANIIKALFKRNIHHVSMLVRPDTYQDLKLEIWLVLCQVITLSFTA